MTVIFWHVGYVLLMQAWPDGSSISLFYCSAACREGHADRLSASSCCLTASFIPCSYDKRRFAQWHKRTHGKEGGADEWCRIGRLSVVASLTKPLMQPLATPSGHPDPPAIPIHDTE